MPLRVTTLDQLPSFGLVPGVVAKPLFGNRLMFNFLRFEPGGTVPLHDHPHEQFGLVLEGEITLKAEGEVHVLGPNSVYAIPGGMPHEGQAGPTGCIVLDVFTPIREEYRVRAEAEAR
jgi:unsaturated pyranuronate lyase